MEKNKSLQGFCKKCKNNTVTNKKIKNAFDYICYLEDLITNSGYNSIPLNPNPNEEYSYSEDVFYKRVVVSLTGVRQQQFNVSVSEGVGEVLKLEVASVKNNNIIVSDSLTSLSNSFVTDKPTFKLRSLNVNNDLIINLSSEVVTNPSATETFDGQLVNIDVYYTKSELGIQSNLDKGGKGSTETFGIG